MSEATHTPGPWRWDGVDPDGPCLEGVDMEMVKAAIAKATGKEMS